MQMNDHAAHRNLSLEAIAELMLWAGWDRAADEIYATIYGADAEECKITSLRSWLASRPR